MNGEWRPYEQDKDNELRARIHTMRIVTEECDTPGCRYQKYCRMPNSCKSASGLVK